MKDGWLRHIDAADITRESATSAPLAILSGYYVKIPLRYWRHIGYVEEER